MLGLVSRSCEAWEQRYSPRVKSSLVKFGGIEACPVFFPGIALVLQHFVACCHHPFTTQTFLPTSKCPALRRHVGGLHESKPVRVSTDPLNRRRLSWYLAFLPTLQVVQTQYLMHRTGHDGSSIFFQFHFWTMGQFSWTVFHVCQRQFHPAKNPQNTLNRRDFQTLPGFE